MENAFPELGLQVPLLTQLKQESIEGFVKRDFALYKPLTELAFEADAPGCRSESNDAPSRCKLTRVNGEVVVLKVFPVVRGLRHMRRELGILARIKHEHVIRAHAVSERWDQMYSELDFATLGSVLHWARMRGPSGADQPSRNRLMHG